MLISLSQWAANNGHTSTAANKLIQRDKLPQAQKIGRNWVIESDILWPDDKRRKCVERVNDNEFSRKTKS